MFHFHLRSIWSWKCIIDIIVLHSESNKWYVVVSGDNGKVDVSRALCHYRLSSYSQRSAGVSGRDQYLCYLVVNLPPLTHIRPPTQTHTWQQHSQRTPRSSCYQWSCLPVKWSTNRCFFLEHSVTFPVFCCSCLSLSEPCCSHQFQNKHVYLQQSKRLMSWTLTILSLHCLQSSRQKHWTAELHFVEVCIRKKKKKKKKKLFHHQNKMFFFSFSVSLNIYFILSDCFIFSVDVISLFISDLSGRVTNMVVFGIITSTAEEKLHFRKRSSNFEVLVLHLSISILLYLLYFRPPLHYMYLITLRN